MKNNDQTFKNCNAVLMYSFNFEQDFIKKAFSKPGGINDMSSWYEQKFKQFCKDTKESGVYGSTALAFMNFYAYLDNRGKNDLINYIVNNYKG